MRHGRERARRKLEARQEVHGCSLDYPTTALAVDLARGGFDLIFIDCEHGGPGIERVQDLAIAAKAAGAAAVLRPWSKDPGLLRRYVDCGIDGVIWPEIEDAAEVAHLRDLLRGSVPAEADTLILIGLVETEGAAGRARDLAEAPGLDGLLIGPGDLAASCGLPRTSHDPRLDALHRDILDAAREAGLSAGGPVTALGRDKLAETGANILMRSAAELLRIGMAGATSREQPT